LADEEKKDAIALSKHALEKATAFIDEKNKADADEKEQKKMKEEFNLL
jgi:hypothetical protein